MPPDMSFSRALSLSPSEQLPNEFFFSKYSINKDGQRIGLQIANWHLVLFRGFPLFFFLFCFQFSPSSARPSVEMLCLYGSDSIVRKESQQIGRGISSPFMFSDKNGPAKSMDLQFYIPSVETTPLCAIT